MSKPSVILEYDHMNVTVTCDRCKQQVEGIRHETATGGFYVVALTDNPTCSPDKETTRRAQFILDRFLEEAASEDLATEKGTVNKALELLERLWRWQY